MSRPPSEYMREHLWVTTQPMEEPEIRAHLQDVIGWIGADRLHVRDRLSALGLRRPAPGAARFRTRRCSGGSCPRTRGRCTAAVMARHVVAAVARDPAGRAQAGRGRGPAGRDLQRERRVLRARSTAARTRVHACPRASSSVWSNPPRPESIAIRGAARSSAARGTTGSTTCAPASPGASPTAPASAASRSPSSPAAP